MILDFKGFFFQTFFQEKFKNDYEVKLMWDDLDLDDDDASIEQLGVKDGDDFYCTRKQDEDRFKTPGEEGKLKLNNTHK